MRKSLVLPFAMVGLLAVGCDQKPAKKDLFKFEDAIAFYKDNGINDVLLARYEAANAEATVVYDYSEVEDGTLLAKVYGTTRAEFEAYASSLNELGWSLEQDEYDDYCGYFKGTGAYLYLLDYLVVDYPSSTDDCIKLYFEIGQEAVTSFSFDEAVEMFEANGIDDVVIPDYEGEGFRVSYDVDEDYAVFVMSVSSASEMSTFVEAMIDEGWVLTPNEDDDYSGTFGTTRALVSIENWIGYYYDGIVIKFEIGPEVVTDFPLENVNAFLTEYGLGFSFTSETALPDSAGDGYSIQLVEDGDYSGYIIQTSENQMTAYLAILEPIITAANYVLYEDSSTETYKVYCLNGDISSHQVIVRYDSDSNQTTVAFWE